MKIWKTICSSGFIYLKAYTENPERFLNMCTFHAIQMYNLQMKDTTLYLTVSLSDYRKMQPILKKCQIQVEILGEKGLSFLIMELSKKSSLFIGIVSGCLLLFWLSGHIWNIHIEGNERNSTQMILSCLETEGILHGMEKQKVNCGEIASLLQEQFPDITWVSARIQGVRLFIDVKENLEGKPGKEEEKQTQASCDLIADEEGRIVNIITTKGTQKVFPGDQVKKGDLLISGEIEIKNDDQEVRRIQTVCAEGKIILERTITYRSSFPMEYMKKIYQEKAEQAYGIWAGPCYYDTGFLPSIRKKQTEKTYDEQIIQRKLYLTESYALPVSLVLKKKIYWKEIPAVYTEEEALRLASQKVQQFEKNLIEKGVQIYQNNVTMKCDEKICKSEGSFVIRQKIGEKKNIEQDRMLYGKEQIE